MYTAVGSRLKDLEMSKGYFCWNVAKLSILGQMYNGEHLDNIKRCSEHLPKLQIQVMAEMISSTRWIQTRINPEIKKIFLLFWAYFQSTIQFFLKASWSKVDYEDDHLFCSNWDANQPVGTGTLLARPLALLPRLRLFISSFTSTWLWSKGSTFSFDIVKRSESVCYSWLNGKNHKK